MVSGQQGYNSFSYNSTEEKNGVVEKCVILNGAHTGVLQVYLIHILVFGEHVGSSHLTGNYKLGRWFLYLHISYSFLAKK